MTAMNILVEILVTFFAGMGAGLGTGFAGMSAAAVISPTYSERSCNSSCEEGVRLTPFCPPLTCANDQFVRYVRIKMSKIRIVKVPGTACF